MVDAIITRPVLEITTWIKRNPIKTIAITLLLLFAVPPLLVCLAELSFWLLGVVAKVLGEKAAAAFAKISSSILTWIGKTPAHCIYVGIGLMVLSPFAGALWLLWCFLDTFKTTPVKINIGDAPATPETLSNTPDETLEEFIDRYG